MSGPINIAIKAAYAAGNLIQHESRNISSIKIEKKGHNNYVTELDKKAEKTIISIIKKAFPNHNILAEESGEEKNDSEYTWIIDPIDGTTNFMHNNPQYCVSIALKHLNKITHAVVFDPNRNDLYKAEIGKGAYLNDQRIRVTNTSNIQDSLIATGFPTYDMSQIDKYLLIFKDMLLNTTGQRRFGSAALDLAYVAAGYLDGFWEFNLKPWDIAAGFLLVKEAGGMVTDFQEKQDFWQNGGNIIAANSKIIKQMLNIIQKNL
ncbi:MAG TPA: inositol monophosphatase family protein [Burkholderiales bacterium]|nr:inositol monophosphatase family protein [Burkholderiales bacterium]